MIKTIDDVMNIPFSKCYIDDMVAYRSWAHNESQKCESSYWYGKPSFGASFLLHKRADGCLTLSLPKRVYIVLADYLSTQIDTFRFDSMTVGDVYTNIPQLSSVPRCGEETARTILVAFTLLKNRVSVLGIRLDVSHWEKELSHWKKNKGDKI